MTDRELIKKEYIRLQKYELEELYPRERTIFDLNQIKDRLSNYVGSNECISKVDEIIKWATDDLESLRKGFTIYKEIIYDNSRISIQ